MVLFKIVESDFWGNCPVKKVYELDEQVALEFGNIIHSCLIDHLGKLYKRVRVIKGVQVGYSMEVSSHFQKVQFNFRTRHLQGRAEDFVAYCLYAVSCEFLRSSTATYEIVDGYVEVRVALDQPASISVCEFLEFLRTGEVKTLDEVSTWVYTSVS